MGLPEEKLKKYILSQYRSLREFTVMINMPYSTIDTILKRGIRKANVDNIIKICDFFNINTDALIEGKIEKRTNDGETIAAHKNGENFTPDELEKIEEYKKLLIAARPKE